MASGTIKAVASKADVNALNDQFGGYSFRTDTAGNAISADDVNNGFYFGVLTAATSPTGIVEWWQLYTSKIGSAGMQIAQSLAGKLYMRPRSSGTFGSWKLVADNSSITPSSGTVTAASNVTLSNLSCKKSANIVTINGAAVLTGSFAGKDALIMTLPTGYRPSSRTSIFVYTTYNGVVGMYHFWVNTNGEVVTQVGGNNVTNEIFFNVSFCI